jgi:hypothetical protein
MSIASTAFILHWQVNNMTAASMAAVAHLRALQSFRLQAGSSR